MVVAMNVVTLFEEGAVLEKYYPSKTCPLSSYRLVEQQFVWDHDIL